MYILSQGYERVYMDIAEINIDVPRAYFILEQFVDKSFSMGIIDVKLRDLCPCRWAYTTGYIRHTPYNCIW